MTNRILNVGDIVMDKRWNSYEIINEIDYEQDLIAVRALFSSDDVYNYGSKVFYRNYTMISSVGD